MEEVGAQIPGGRSDRGEDPRAEYCGVRIIYSALPITTYKLITTEKTDEGVKKDRPIDYPWEEGLCPLSCLEAQTLLKEQSRS